MKIYESNLAQLSGHIFWTFCLYAVVALLMWYLLYLTGNLDCSLYTFLIIVITWLGQSRRFHKMCYRINDDTLVQYDFHTRTLFIDQIVSICILERMKWISFHTPYNIVIQTKNKEKYFMAPQNAEHVAEILKKINPQIKVIQE